MIDTTTINHDVSAPVQTNPQKHYSATKQPPIDDLISAVDDFKTKLKALSEDLALQQLNYTKFEYTKSMYFQKFLKILVFIR